MRVEEAMHRGVEWCGPDENLADIAKRMRDRDIGCMPVGENDKLIGMVTDRDIVVRGLAEGKNFSKLSARDVMSEGITYCTTDQDLEEAIDLMEEKEIRRMPVIDANKRMVGMLALGDLSHAVNRELTGEFAKHVSEHHASAA